MSAAAQTTKRGRMVIPPVQRAGRKVEISETKDSTSLKIVDSLGNEDSYTRWGVPTNPRDRVWWKPGCWHLYRSRVGNDGERWSAACGRYVMDDFGFLVQVAP
ncbi:MAG: hypothetical protein U1C04_18770 [Hydrogenophaga sp.]|uniref:hypothetical protein n=1 Tax=Hydrogenophaga sp. TaxID=1904254 RepID=UPI002ABC5A91|nr:hypothetical protein [Hydrogenophaga sp.]MDZ4282794.1 hypothetical protein [Hydrogenophaga sp.]